MSMTINEWNEDTLQAYLWLAARHRMMLSHNGCLGTPTRSSREKSNWPSGACSRTSKVPTNGQQPSPLSMPFASRSAEIWLLGYLPAPSDRITSSRTTPPYTLKRIANESAVLQHGLFLL